MFKGKHLEYKLKIEKESVKSYKKHLSFKWKWQILEQCLIKLTSKIGCSVTTMFAPSVKGVSFKHINVNQKETKAFTCITLLLSFNVQIHENYN